MTVQRARDSFSDKPRFLSFTRNVTIFPLPVDRVRVVVGGSVRVWSKDLACLSFFVVVCCCFVIYCRLSRFRFVVLYSGFWGIES